jgi:hypothetical protein
MGALTLIDVILGVAVLVVPAVLLVAALGLIARLAEAGELTRGLGYVVFLPTRRRQFLVWLLVLTVLFLAGGMINGLALLRLVPDRVDDPAVAVVTVLDALVLFLLMYRGLRPRTLEESEIAAVAGSEEAIAGLGIVGASRRPAEKR